MNDKEIKDQMIKNLQLAQKLLADVYAYAEIYDFGDVSRQMSVADSCIIGAIEELK